ncbi:MAG: hypothetical protein JKY42_11175 [Flavobacteriales bacterium]|nr:hypothetical protein [Flavobacteriales bacterium]
MKNVSKEVKLVVGMILLMVAALSMSSCGNKKVELPKKLTKDFVHHSVLQKVRLGDGVPLAINVSVRWRIEDYATFSNQFENPNSYDSLILEPRELELANDISNKYSNVDTLFNFKRHEFINEIKSYLKANLGEEGISIKEVIVSDIVFPRIYTDNKEKLALQDQELERIKKQTIIDMQLAEASKSRAEGDGKVAMAKAEMNAKVQKIKAQTEKSIRLSKLAKAETQKQVAKLDAESDTQRKKLLAKAELERQEDLKNLEMRRKREENQIALENEKEKGQLEFDADMRMAQLCTENPVYATYMVNKELASKVQIAVLPNGQDGSVLSGFLSSNSTR